MNARRAHSSHDEEHRTRAGLKMVREVPEGSNLNIAAGGKDRQRVFGQRIAPCEADIFVVMGEFQDERGNAGEHLGE